MPDEHKTMTQDEHRDTALEFLAASDREFDASDPLQASEKLWGAATHAVMAAALDREWDECRSHRAMKNAADRLADERPEARIDAGFLAAEKFHKNFYHNEMEEYEVVSDRPKVHRMVHAVLENLNGAG